MPILRGLAKFGETGLDLIESRPQADGHLQQFLDERVHLDLGVGEAPVIRLAVLDSAIQAFKAALRLVELVSGSSAMSLTAITLS